MITESEDDRWLRRNGGRVLCRRPLIITGTTAVHNLPIGPASVLAPYLDDRPVTYLVRLFWQAETPAKLAELVDAHRRHAAAHPAQRVVVLANGAREFWRLQRAGIPTFLCSQNAFVDETTFDVMSSERKEFDAVYTARLQPYKRHSLAAAIPSLALIYDAATSRDRERHEEIQRILPHAVRANREETRRAMATSGGARARLAARVLMDDGYAAPMPPARVAAWLNRARVGLCLSRSEGAMFASIEYLLCGLPVVSTHSIGGRDRYFDPDHTRIVADDPAAVAAGVAELAAARIDPHAVRARALAMMRLDRRAFVSFVQELIDEGGGDMDFAARFPAILTEGLFPLSAVAGIAADVLG